MAKNKKIVTFFCSNKGTMSLALNSIVILILAIAFLGLGVMFTKKMMYKTSKQLKVPDVDIYVSEEEPLGLSDTKFEVRKDKQSSVNVAYFNSCGKAEITPTMTCMKMTPEVVTAGQTIDAMQSRQYKIVFKFTEADMDICTIEFNHPTDSSCRHSKQIEIKSR